MTIVRRSGQRRRPAARAIVRVVLAVFGALCMPAWTAIAAAAEKPRIVALGGAITEVIYALHAEDTLAGVDTTSLYPPEALKAKPNVGYVRNLSAEGILSLRPTLILAIPGAGPKDALGLVRQAGVRFITIPDDPTAAGVARKIVAVGAALGNPQPAQALADTVTANFKALDVLRAQITRPRRVLFLLSLQNGRSLVAGSRTAADGVIRLAGSTNAAGGFDGYKTMTDEAIVAAAPDVLLTMQNAGSAVTADTLFERAAYATTPAAKSRALVSMDGLFLLGFGPREPEAVRDLIGRLYPSLAQPHP